jgi:hypothetical protein
MSIAEKPEIVQLIHLPKTIVLLKSWKGLSPSTDTESQIPIASDRVAQPR